MKNLIKLCLVLLTVMCYSCEDPFKDETFTVYDIQPISSYLETRSDEFSEWVHILKYADMYNAINQSTEKFTAFVPTNEAVKAFYNTKKVSSIEELGMSYARQLVQYHVINDSIDLEEFSKGGRLEDKTLSGDPLEVTFNDGNEEGGFNSIYMNGETHVKELAIHTSNGYVYVLDDVMRPMIESIYQMLYENNKNNILAEAMDMTGWKDTLEVIADTLYNPDGSKYETRRYYTILAVPDEIYQNNGITSVSDLISKLGAQSDYTNAENALNRYVAYHIMEGRYQVNDLKTFDVSTDQCKLWRTMASNTLVKMTREAGNVRLNNDGGTEYVATLIEGESDFQTRNGYIHQIDGVLPICKTLKPVKTYWEFTDYPEVANYINSNGVDGQIFQEGIDASYEPSTEMWQANLACYKYEVGPQGMPTSSYGNLAYRTCRINSNYDQNDTENPKRFLHEDMLTISIGYQGYIIMKTPPMIPGKYKVTLRYFYANSMQNFRSLGEGSNGGLTTFEFTDLKDVTPATPLLYSGLPGDKDENGNYIYRMSLYDTVLYDVLDMGTEIAEHPVKITLSDPAASISKNYRIQIDYILFEPIN